MSPNPSSRPQRDPAGGVMYVGPSLGRSLVGVLVAIARGRDLSDPGPVRDGAAAR